MKLQSINPSTGKVITTYEPTKPGEINQAVSNARKAQKDWARLTVAERIVYFKKLQNLIKNNLNEISALMLEEAGVCRPDGDAEIYEVIDAIGYYIDGLRKIKPNTSIKLNSEVYPDTDVVIDYLPYGVVGLIMPWNFPFYVPMMIIIPIILVGNTVVFKPSEYSTLVGLKIAELFKQAGFPKHVIEVVAGADETGKALVQSAVDKIFFVGSVNTGKHIIQNAGIKPVQVELGGNSAAIVGDDADMDLATQAIAWGGAYHAGQDCAGIKRVFVTRKKADQFIPRLVDLVKNLRPGVDYGPYISATARDEVERRISLAVKAGAKVLTGGKRIKPNGQKGFWLTPSVIQIYDQNTLLVSEETFGNTIPVMVVASEKEAIRATNETNYGLSNVVFTKDMVKANKYVYELESGMVFINEPFVTLKGWDHWTGWKNSGFGTTEGKLMQGLKKKVITINKKGHKRAFWFPYPS